VGFQLLRRASPSHPRCLGRLDLEGRCDNQESADGRVQIARVRAEHPVLDKMVTMREELRQLWLSTSASREQLAGDLQGWCRRAEESGIAALHEFSLKLRAARA